MKYFIDFEAQQFSNYIIAVGCVRENGDTFYSLVQSASRKNKKITPFITDLTGITNEMLADAPSADEVFEKFFDWCAEYPDDVPEFYCYGNSDAEFVKANFAKNKNFKAKSILGYLYSDLIDYAPTVKAHFGLVKLIGLAKVTEYYSGNEIVQSHNALEDAVMLKYVYDQIQEHSMQEDETAFPDYKTNGLNPSGAKKATAAADLSQVKIASICCANNKKLTKEVINFDNIEQAVQFAISQIPEAERAQAIPENILKRIKNSSTQKKSYIRKFWHIEI